MTFTVLPRSTARVDASLTTVVRLDRSQTVVVLQGDAGITNRAALSDVFSRVITSRAGDVVVDLSELGFIDSGGVRIFAISQEWLDRQGRTLSFRLPSPLATRVLDQWGLAALIESREGAPR
jgi:anti-anti-sigma factor